MMTRLRAVLLLLAFAPAACVSMSAARAEPSSAVDAFVSAMQNADADALAEVFAEDATVFMPFEEVPRRLEGKDEIRRVFAKFFEGVRKPGTSPPYMKLVAHDLRTQNLGDTAVVTFHLTSPARLSRRTFVVREMNGRWLVTHLHASNVQVQPAL